MAIKFIVDSGSDITAQQCAEKGIIHLPLKVIFGAQEYEDTINLSHREFYEKLIETDELPSTSQVTPAAFEDAFRKVVEAGDTAIAIVLSSKLSGTYQSAIIAAAEFKPGQVYVVDSLSVSLGQRILVQRAMAMAEKGFSPIEIVKTLEEEKHRIRLMALVDTLEYLKRGGRVSKTVAFAGGVLNIKPVIALVDGEVVMAGKARGSKQANNLLREMVAQRGVDFDRPLCLAYSGLSDEMLRKYIVDSAELWEGHIDSLPVATVGCAIGTHAGPGAVAVAFFEKQ